MQRIWEFVPWLPYDVDGRKLASHCRFVNDEEVFLAGMSPGKKRDDAFPVPQLALTLDDFTIDCFTLQGLALVSKKMRSAMDAAEDEIEYFPIDSSASSSVVSSANYAVMSVCSLEQISYPSQKRAYASQEEYLASLLYGPDDINVFGESQHEIFHDTRFLGSVFCTDGFALRVLQANCTGVRFLDPQHRRGIGPMRFRTLAGIEEEGEWDPVMKIERTKLIQPVLTKNP